MITCLDNIPQEMRELQRWVCVKADSKKPMRCDSTLAASVAKPDTWGTFEEAKEALETGVYEYAGFVFDNDGLIGIDIDNAFGDDGLPTDDALEAVYACASYTELSKSGHGFHIICKGELPFKGRNNRCGWEIYRESRYFVLTGQTIMFSDLAIAQDGINQILAKHFSDTEIENNSERKNRIWEPIWTLDEASGRMSVEWDGVPRGSRHISLVSYCGYIHNCSAHKDALYQAALAQNEKFMSPPLPEDEVRQIVNSVTRYKR